MFATYITKRICYFPWLSTFTFFSRFHECRSHHFFCLNISCISSSLVLTKTFFPHTHNRFCYKTNKMNEPRRSVCKSHILHFWVKHLLNVARCAMVWQFATKLQYHAHIFVSWHTLQFFVPFWHISSFAIFWSRLSSLRHVPPSTISLFFLAHNSPQISDHPDPFPQHTVPHFLVSSHTTILPHVNIHLEEC